MHPCLLYFQMGFLSYYRVSLFSVLMMLVILRAVQVDLNIRERFILFALAKVNQCLFSSFLKVLTPWCTVSQQTPLPSSLPPAVMRRNLSVLVRPERRTVLVEAGPRHCQGNTAITLVIAVFSAPGNSVARATVR